MSLQLRSKILASAAFLAALSAAPAFAGTVYESASYTGVDTGEYIVQDGRSIGAVFNLSQTTNITGIGAQFGGFPSGTIFGAIVSLADPTSIDPSNLAASALAHVVFSVPVTQAIDLLEPLSAKLQAGTYGVIFGSGQFGASGWAGLGDGNDTIGSPVMFQTLYDNTWQPQSADGIRIFVEGTAAAVPEPASWAMMIGGLGIVGGAMRRRQTVRVRFA
jgi:hypothetical protein